MFRLMAYHLGKSAHFPNTEGGLPMTLTYKFSLGLTACLIFAGQTLLAHDPHDPMDTIAFSPNFANDQTVYVATDAVTFKIQTYEMLRSTDGGATWTILPNIQNNNVVRKIAVSPGYAQDQTLFVAGDGGLFRTTDAGTNWVLVTTKPMRSMVLSPNYSTDHTLFVVTSSNGIEMSTDSGKSFKNVPAPANLKSTLDYIAISPNYTVDKTLLLGGGGNDGIFESTNAGGSWTSVTSGLSIVNVTCIVFSPGFATDKTVFATSKGSGLFKSTTGGTSWAASNTGITDLNASSLALSSTFSQDSTLWLTAAVGGIFQSTNAGASWSLSATVPRELSGATTFHYKAIAETGSAASPVLFVGMYEGLWKSTNPSVWNYVDVLPTRLVRHITLSPNFANDNTVFANTYGGGNLWSTDGGATYNFSNTGMQEAYTDAVGISPNYAVDGIVFSSNSKGLERSNDFGQTWQMMEGVGTTDYPRAVAVSPNFANDQTVLIGTKKQGGGDLSGLWLSTDQGNIWNKTSLNGIGVVSISMSPGWATDQTAFAASPDTTYGLYKSTDGALTWTNITTTPASAGPMCVVAVSPSFPTDQTLVAAPQDAGLYKSTDGGNTWTLLPNTGSVRFVEIRFSPNWASDQTIWAGTLQKGLAKFTNGGSTLSYITAFSNSEVSAVAISPNFTADQTIFSAAYWGIYKSTDGGNTWTYAAEPGRAEEFRQFHSQYAPQNPPTFVFTGSWLFPEPETAASTYEYAQASASSASVLFNFYGTGIRYISWTGPEQGQAAIVLDGVSEGTVTLTAPTDQYQQDVWELHGLTCGLHQLTVTPIVANGQTVTVDAFDYWANGCPATNGPMARQRQPQVTAH